MIVEVVLFGAALGLTQAEAVIQKSCGQCHVAGAHRLPFVDATGEVDWDIVEANAARIVEVLETKRMPPPFAPPSAQITDEERADLLDYVSTLIPLENNSPIIPDQPDQNSPVQFDLEAPAERVPLVD